MTGQLGEVGNFAGRVSRRGWIDFEIGFYDQYGSSRDVTVKDFAFDVHKSDGIRHPFIPRTQDSAPFFHLKVKSLGLLAVRTLPS